ncbi:hypothetical protein HLV39_02795 [Marinobacter adhaerens]|uniref:Uncharacterized protein n=1 Tax=Marinobacter adhaerens TaxID=1033846 RepID=A0A851HNH3_9GAMM|nr:hypothetical protein [Marinobacter adhaerens]NWN90427.1 hypothetical protein [Marinobacter adhaerens]
MIKTISDSGLPRLAWFGAIDKSTLTVTVFHGADVEVTDNFIVEGVWEGAFELGDFHCAEHFFGSGLISKDNSVWLVPSSALVDKLFFCEDDQYFYASNSLICLLAYLDAELDPENNYKKQSDSIMSGVDHYESSFPILHPRIKKLEQLFYFPVKLSSSRVEKKPTDTPHSFKSYSTYYNAVRQSLKAIRANSESPKRKKQFLAYTTVSRGYDSAATTALTHDLNIRKAFTSRKSSSAFPSWIHPNAAVDDGTCIAQGLDLEVSYLDFKPGEIREDETLFICTTPAEPEIVFYKAYQELAKNNAPSIVFTGYHGDELWNRVMDPGNGNRDIIRGGVSGVNLGELRLAAGFINLPVPFMYAREVSSLNTISNSDEMAPWSIGGDYDRPIARRILEEQGIPRSAFGTQKKTVISFYNKPKNKLLRKAFYKSLKEEHKIGLFRCMAFSTFDFTSFYGKKILNLATSYFGVESKPQLTIKSLDIPYKMFLWAVDYEKRRITKNLDHTWDDHENIKK